MQNWEDMLPIDDEQAEIEESAQVVSDVRKSKEDKLFSLRLKLNTARSANLAEVAEEDRRAKQPKNAEAKREREDYQRTRNAEAAELVEQGLDPEKEHLLQESAAEATWRASKSQRKQGTFGWEQFNTDADYNSYHRRIKEFQVDPAAYEQQRVQVGDDEFYRGASQLTYGQAPAVAPRRVDRMADELAKQVAKRSQYSRHRERVDGQYMYHINDRNRKFNSKLERAFGPYTVEIRQNLERGTAL